MRIIISGATGLIGSALCAYLRERGHQVARLVRRQQDVTPGDALWKPSTGRLDPAQLEGADAVIHLSGENIGTGRWSRAKKRAIRESRLVSTQLLAGTMAEMNAPPATWLCASAIGYYGNQANAVLDEDTGPGEGFLAVLCRDWETATRPASDKGVRVVNLRFGVVLSADGGALKTMLTPFKLGAGGIVGNGGQYMSWVAMPDVTGAIAHALNHGALSGPINVTSPDPVTNRTFTMTLAHVLRRPALLPVPAPLLRLVLGEMADALLLSSVRAVPKRLSQSGYVFAFDGLEAALRAELK